MELIEILANEFCRQKVQKNDLNSTIVSMLKIKISNSTKLLKSLSSKLLQIPKDKLIQHKLLDDLVKDAKVEINTNEVKIKIREYFALFTGKFLVNSMSAQFSLTDKKALILQLSQ